MPNLVFHSGQTMPQSEKMERELLAFLGKPNPVYGYISSGADPERRAFMERREYYAAFGVDLGVYIELETNFFPEILPSLLACDAIHLPNENPYHVLHWLRQRDMLDTLRTFIEKEGVLIGEGTGAMLLTPDISAAALFDMNPEDPDMDLTALRLVDFVFIPRLDTLPDGFNAVRSYSLSHHLPIYGCREGDGILIKGNELVRLGEVVLIENGGIVSGP
jgi:dipeptidase E